MAALAAPAWAQSAAQKQRRQEEERINELYQRAADTLDEGDWQKAADDFARVAEAGGFRADAAIYWRAYALNKLGRRTEALETLGTLIQSHPSSAWIGDARALEIEIRQAAGQPVHPENLEDEELKLLAINALMHRDAEEAVAILDRLLKGTASPKLKDRALFVLAQHRSAQARNVMGQIARGEYNPDLQRRAVRYLGIHGNAESRQILADIYAASQDAEIKKAILHSYMIGGDRARLLAAARNETSPEIRNSAVHWLGTMGADDELWQLYGSESSIEAKKRILHSLAIGGKVDRVIEVARSEREPELRRQAIHSLGLAGSRRTGDVLVSLYGEKKDREVRRQIVNALFIQGNARALVDLAPQGDRPRDEEGSGEPALPDEIEGGHRLPVGDPERVGALSWVRPGRRRATMRNRTVFVTRKHPMMAVVAVLALAAAAEAQQPRVTNAQVETRAAGAGLEPEFHALLESSTMPAWIAWGVPVVTGRHRSCCGASGTTFADRSNCCTSCRLEGSGGEGRPNVTTGTVQLEGPRLLFVLARAESRTVTQIRSYTEDCEIDAGGLPFLWGARAKTNTEPRRKPGFFSASRLHGSFPVPRPVHACRSGTRRAAGLSSACYGFRSESM